MVLAVGQTQPKQTVPEECDDLTVNIN